MLFPTVTFAIFFMIVLPVSWLLMPKPARWKIFIIAASYYFYGYWDWRFVFLLGASTLGNQLFGRLIHRSEDDRARRGLLFGAVAMNLGLLGYFKYYDFFVSSGQNILRDLGISISPQIIAITLPVGISFFTFQALSYVVDIYRGNFEPVPLGEFAVYLSFFPHLVAGPIVRAAEFLPQLHERHDPRRVDGSRAFFLVASGLFKKVVIANFLATEIVDKVFASPGRHSGFEALIAIYAYAVQIYADFSGYTDIAIGLALMLGFRFPQNFDAPYSARSLQDFWRRWHMTLSRWLRDYLYIPLGGNRRGRLATYRNLMLTFVLGGMWHGAAWTFVVWGAIHGAVLAFEHWRHEERIARGLPEVEDTWRRRLVDRLVTFHIVCLAWVFFRADSFSNAAAVLGRLLFHWGGGAALVTPWVLVAIAVGIGSQYVPGRAIARLMSEFSRLSPVIQGATLGVGLLVINVLGPRGVAPFIYFKF
ncbi:MAG TPA: MBOAT family protein [Acidimicrobiia bacterium]|nr:MBOAT family protein [Acidimicrobiia bacterium]